jgi:hypothetical protein
VTIKGIVLALNRFPVLTKGFDMFMLRNSAENCNIFPLGGKEVWLDVRLEHSVAWSLMRLGKEALWPKVL